MSQRSFTYRSKHNDESNNRLTNSSKFIFRKIDPPKPSTQKADVYVTNKSNFKSHLERIEKLWNKGEPQIIVRALGSAIPRGINLCLQFQKNHYNCLDLNVTTDTVHLMDEFEPITDDDDFETTTRKNSSVCIKITRKKEFSAGNSSE